MSYNILEHIKKNLKNKNKGMEDSNPTEICFTDDINTNKKSIKEEIEPINEVLSISMRLKKRQQIRRNRVRLKNARGRALKRRANNATIQKRARKTAINNMKRRFSGGKSVSKLNAAQKIRVEKIVHRRKTAIQRSTRRLINTKRQQDRTRIFNRSKR